MPVRLLRGLAAAILLGAVLHGAAPAADLPDLRAERRARVRAAAAATDKAGGGAPFGLLVIPVDFADRRLPAGWHPPAALGPRLEGPGQTLRTYFEVASGGACDLRITLAPLVCLPGTRRDYSDLGLNGFTRTRRLATEAITAVRDLGLPFRRLDNDGPDGLAGTADDDGQVDGVLILHAGVGLENDLDEGLVQPLQYFLEPPVLQDGVAASFYAVAALGSGLGIWAHETAHLLGLEERYDLHYAAAGASEVHSRGGLGRFSLMAAGAWGTGGGAQPALLDAYSRLQLGWGTVADAPAEGHVDATLTAAANGGSALRVWTHGRPGDEYFLLEVREPHTGFDAAVPAGELLVYHVDETVPETAWSSDGGVHLRVQLVEADGDGALRAGLDEGSVDDLFPGGTGATAFGPATVPSSAGYRGPSAVAVTGITRTVEGVLPAVGCRITAADGPALAVDLAFTDAPQPVLDLAVASVGTPLAAPTATLAAGFPPLGAFVGGGSEVAFALVPAGPGRWVPDRSVAWVPDAGLAAGASTRFVLTVSDGPWTSPAAVRTWHWDANGAALAFCGAWPGTWTLEHPDSDASTTWHRWDDRSPAVPVGAHVLACADQAHATGEAWPGVAYTNGAHATLTSAPLGAAVRAVRLVHAWDTEALVPGVFMDGAALVWVGPDGAEQPGVPVDGWPGRVDGQSLAALHGRAAWGGAGDLTAVDLPVWRTDVVPVPAGPGPWRLRLVFASNTRGWEHRGWLVASLEPLTAAPPASALPLTWDGAGLGWTWPEVPAGEVRFVVQREAAGNWIELLERTFNPAPAGPHFAVPAAEVLAALPPGDRTRWRLRVSGPLGQGTLASGSVVVFPDGGDGAAVAFARPWPNPATDGVRSLLTVPPGPPARLGVYDLAGRLVASWDCPPGEHLVHWDGTGRGGARAAAGTYILRLEGSNGVLTHKVVLLP
ncbi:MAG: immune inhibitor A domain-containing protein [Candidatus Krumholzibacteriia bacterium]